jgi:hypothetical protein
MGSMSEAVGSGTRRQQATGWGVKHKLLVRSYPLSPPEGLTVRPVFPPKASVQPRQLKCISKPAEPEASTIVPEADRKFKLRFPWVR